MSGLSPDGLADAFMEWFRKNHMENRYSEEEIRLCAAAFNAGVAYGIRCAP